MKYPLLCCMSFREFCNCTSQEEDSLLHEGAFDNMLFILLYNGDEHDVTLANLAGPVVGLCHKVDGGAKVEFVRSVLSERGTVPTLAAQSVAQVVNQRLLSRLTSWSQLHPLGLGLGSGFRVQGLMKSVIDAYKEIVNN